MYIECESHIVQPSQIRNNSSNLEVKWLGWILFFLDYYLSGFSFIFSGMILGYSFPRSILILEIPQALLSNPKSNLETISINFENFAILL